ncbi:hypothetical protein BDW59DRAFT_157697 [Aspergillus cavernicola]|uniref:Rhodopsin domain-containing protein n=1 Tax=Aspergillus cavernicola TaxID=176166 RepID=A0ABR4IVG3_9EURO
MLITDVEIEAANFSPQEASFLRGGPCLSCPDLLGSAPISLNSAIPRPHVNLSAVMVDESAAVRGVAAAFLTMSSIAVTLRCYVRLRLVKAFGWDDSIMILAMLFYIVFCSCMIGGSLWGTGKHLLDLTAKQRTMAMKYWFLCNVTYAVSSVLAKISVSIFLLRVMLFPSHRTALLAVTGLAVATGIVFFVLLVIQCSPVSFWWTRMSGDTDGKCGYVDAIAIMLYLLSASSAIFDLTVGLLPIFLVRKLQMNHQTKVAVAGLLGMACIASIAIIIRIPFVQTIHNPDFLYATVQIAIWSAIETGLSITAGSLATTRPLFRIFSSSSPSSSPSSRNHHHYHRRNPSSYHPFDISNNSNNNNSRHNHHSRKTSKISTKIPLQDIDTNIDMDSGIRLGIGRNSSVSSRGTGGRNNGFFEPYIGVVTIRSTVEGGCADGDEFGGEVCGLDKGIAARSGSGSKSGSRSRIGVHRTFEVSRGGRDE